MINKVACGGCRLLLACSSATSSAVASRCRQTARPLVSSTHLGQSQATPSDRLLSVVAGAAEQGAVGGPRRVQCVRVVAKADSPARIRRYCRTEPASSAIGADRFCLLRKRLEARSHLH